MDGERLIDAADRELPDIEIGIEFAEIDADMWSSSSSVCMGCGSGAADRLASSGSAFVNTAEPDQG